MVSLCRGTAVSVAVFLAAGCATPAAGAGGAGVPGKDGKNGAVSTQGRVGASGGGLDADTAREEAARILEAVAEARNLEVLKSVKVDVMDRPGIREFARKSLYEHITPEELQLQGRIESAIGVIPVGADPETVLLDMLEDGILGYYDPKAKTLFIGDFVPQFMLSQVVGHEIAHGLQDMHFDLAKYQEPIDHHSDAESARSFLIEGGAQAAYFAWVSGEDGLASIDDAVLDAMANQTLDYAKAVSEFPVLARSLQMPYTDGTATVIRLVLAKGWSAVDALYADVPTTTEQMLHLDKLLSREPAKPVALDTSELESATGLKTVWFDELGEASLLAMLAEVEPSTTARAAATGWGGGHLVALANPADPDGSVMIVGAVVWDTTDDAEEFEVTFAKYLDEETAGGTFIRRRRDAVVFGTNIPEEELAMPVAELHEMAWKALSRKAAKGASR